MFFLLNLNDFPVRSGWHGLCNTKGQDGRIGGDPWLFLQGDLPLTATVATTQAPASTWTCTTASACASSREGARTAGAMPQGGEGNSFMDFLGNLVDVVNPLQHIPVVSSLYRRLTGDQIGGAAMIAGGALYGGPIGGAVAAANVAIAQESGGYAGDRMLARALGDAPQTAPPAASATMLASAQSAPAISAPAAPDTGLVTLAAASGDSFFVSSNSASLQTPSLSASPTPNRTRTANGETATSRASDTPMIRQYGTESVPATFRHSGSTSSVQRLTALAEDASSSSLPEAPADSRMEIPPELMALKMKEGLDKYAAMKSRGL